MMTENEKQLVEGHLYLIRNIILNTIGMNKNTEELEYNDLYQTGCEALCHAATQYKQDKGASFPTYASIVIRHALLSQCRKASKWQGIIVSLDAPLSDDKELTLSDVLKDPNDQAFSDLETRLMLRAYENNQTEPARKHLEMFLLNRLCGYNISELAAYYKVSHSVVSTGIFRAKQKLRIYYFLSA